MVLRVVKQGVNRGTEFYSCSGENEKWSVYGAVIRYSALTAKLFRIAVRQPCWHRYFVLPADKVQGDPEGILKRNMVSRGDEDRFRAGL